MENIDIFPKEVRSHLISAGILELKGFQLEGIKAGLGGKNVLVVAPTGAGKTLIGEILGVLKVVKDKNKVLFLVPYKALAEEFYNTFSRKYPFIRFDIGTGDYLDKPNELLGRDGDFLIVTYEKADSIVRNPPSWFKDVGLVIVDEVHLLSDYDRGPILDNILTHCLIKKIQIIALSATIPNPEDLSKWLKAELISSTERPVKLIEGVYLHKRRKLYFFDPSPNIEEEVYVGSYESKDKRQELSLEEILKAIESSVKGKVKVAKVGESKKIEREKCVDDLVKKLHFLFNSNCSECFYCMDVSRGSNKRGFLGAVIDLINDTLQRAKEIGVLWQVLVFRKSRRLTQITAKNIAEFIKKSGLAKLFPYGREIAKKLLSEIDEPTPMTDELSKYLEYGVAFHHAGLSHKERIIIEKAFRERKIGIIIATPTLAAGINLPARRVIIEHKFYWGGENEISVAEYKQRSGRAGRPGLDNVGEAILIANNEDELFYLFDKYIFGELERVESKFGLNLPALRDQILALIVSSSSISYDGIKRFFSKTFYYFLKKRRREDKDVFFEYLSHVINDLRDWGFVKEKDGVFYSTEIGVIISKMYLDPLTAHLLIDFLNKNKKPSEVESLYAILSTPDLSNFRVRALSFVKKSEKIVNKLRLVDNKMIEELNYLEEEIMDVLRYLSDGYTIFLTVDEEEKLSKLFLLILILLWIQNVPVKEILEDLAPNFGAGDFFEMLRSVSRLLYCMIELSRKLKLDRHTIKSLSILRERVEKGVPLEMLELTRIPLIGRARAQILYKNGYRDLRSIAKSSISELSRLPSIGEKIAAEAIKFAKEKIGKREK